jgi:uncharacterized protein YndB with AHSA1/START domain
VRWILALTLLCAFAPKPSLAEETVSNEAVVEGSVDAVWKLLTTQAGLESWVVPHANVDLRTGGFFRTNHMANGKIGDENTVTSQILDVKSKKKLSIRLVEAPKTIPMAASMVGTWYEITLSSLSKKQTRVQCVGHGFAEGPMGYMGRTIAGQGSAWALQTLQKYCLTLKTSKSGK